MALKGIKQYLQLIHLTFSVNLGQNCFKKLAPGVCFQHEARRVGRPPEVGQGGRGEGQEGHGGRW
jgi:hypothetical protein